MGETQWPVALVTTYVAAMKRKKAAADRLESFGSTLPLTECDLASISPEQRAGYLAAIAEYRAADEAIAVIRAQA